MTSRQKAKDLGQHIRRWREIVLQRTPLQIVEHLNKKSDSLKWTTSNWTQIEQGDFQLSFQHWMEVFSLMGRGSIVLDAAYDEQSLYLASAEKNINSEDHRTAFEKLQKKKES